MIYGIRYKLNIKDQLDLIGKLEETRICYLNIYPIKIIKLGLKLYMLKILIKMN